MSRFEELGATNLEDSIVHMEITHIQPYGFADAKTGAVTQY
jgi:hypothetical protein